MLMRQRDIQEIECNYCAIAKNRILSEAGITYYKNVVVKTDDYTRIINKLKLDDKLKSTVNEIRAVENKIRNTAAHSITYITDDVIKQYTGFKSRDIFNMIKRMAVAIGISFNDEAMATYERMNDEIIRRLYE